MPELLTEMAAEPAGWAFGEMSIEMATGIEHGTAIA